MAERDLPHLTSDGHVHMVDVSEKEAGRRQAVAQGRLLARPDVISLVLLGQAPKGDVLAVARVAGIMGAKRTAEWIPLAHPLSLSSVEVDIRSEPNAFVVTATVQTVGPTGVEMEALTAVSATLLTLYDMLKARDRAMTMEGVRLLHKSGGRSGEYTRGEDESANSRVDQQ